MIDIEKAKRFYKEYISGYNPEEPRIALKIAHIYRTSEKAKWLATKLQLKEEDILLAEIIGLLHDIGRFEQVKNYNTFVDRDSINHGEYGVKILFEDNLIRNFIEDSEYDEIIRKAILNHNKNDIDENITDERELIHCKIIRDADKLDIYYVLLNDKLEACYSFDKYPKEIVSNKIKNQFINNHRINYGDFESCADVLVAQIAYIFDINFKDSLIEIAKNNYIEKIIKRYDAKERETIEDIEEIQEVANKYIDEEIKEE